MNLYKTKMIISQRLREWISTEARDGWTSFCRQQALDFGVSKSSIDKMFQEQYPSLDIRNDELTSKEIIED